MPKHDEGPVPKQSRENAAELVDEWLTECEGTPLRRGNRHFLTLTLLREGEEVVCVSERGFDQKPKPESSRVFDVFIEGGPEPKRDVVFSRRSLGAGWVETKIIMPSPLPLDDDYCKTGEAARLKVAKFVLAHAGGIAMSLGMGTLADALERVGEILGVKNA